MGRTVGTLVAVLAVTALLVPTATGVGFGGLEQQSVDPDVVVMTADVAPDGTADWTVAYRIRLDDDNATQAFEDLRADVRADSSAYTDRFRDRMQRTAGAAENTTGRGMAIENVTVSAREETFGQTYGVVTYRFRWTNFAAVSGDRIEIGDALSGLFLDAETSLTVRWPADYRADSVAPAADERGNGSVTWRGQQEFGASEPRVVVSPGDAGGDSGANGLLVGGVLALVGIAVAAYALKRYGAFGGGEQAEPPASMVDSDDSEAETAAGTDADAGEPPAELLSNEEQVLQLLESNGGRLKQQQVAGELDWTDAKTSQVIGGLRDEDKVETFRIGRENVVTLPDTDVTGASGDGGDGSDETQ
ncbi:helix-turn-helix transcriptional regulator [Haloarcula brevis]|uniref:helix-turn-helix transcriptional regulator n=1 Tax=Haloarcula brevis TaxID=3111453 RepID=UPI00300E703A